MVNMDQFRKLTKNFTDADCLKLFESLCDACKDRVLEAVEEKAEETKRVYLRKTHGKTAN